MNLRLYGVTLLHAAFGTGPAFHTVSFNTLEQFLVPVINASVHAHYGVQLDDASLTIVWSVVTSALLLGAVIGCTTLV